MILKHVGVESFISEAEWLWLFLKTLVHADNQESFVFFVLFENVEVINQIALPVRPCSGLNKLQKSKLVLSIRWETAQFK